MTAVMVFTAEQLEAMRAMRRNGKAWKEVAYRFGCSTATARRHLGLLRNAREYHSSVSWRQLNLEPPQRSGYIPDSVLTDRDRRLAVPARDLTAEFFGDPKPGWSALDRR